MPGEERWLDLQLKLLADIGLVGLPNAGKSSMLAALTRARPKVAAYPFTTLEPNLGTLELGERVVVIADIPGLIEGASSGTGLGDRFLAHVERTVVLVYVVDASLGADAALAAVTTVRGELHAFSEQLAAHPGMLALNKVDLLDDDEAAAVEAALAPVTRDLGGPWCGLGGRRPPASRTCVRELDRLSSAQVAAALLEAKPPSPSNRPSCCGRATTASAISRCSAKDEAWRVERPRASSASSPRPSWATTRRCATCRT